MKNRTLNNMLHDVHSTKAFFNIKMSQDFTLHANCNFIYAHKKRKVFSAPIFMKLVNTRQYYVQISYRSSSKSGKKFAKVFLIISLWCIILKTGIHIAFNNIKFY